MTGNYLPINAKVEGEISEVLVEEGDTVNRGDVLVRMKNRELESGLEQAIARQRTARAKVSALQNHLKNYKSKLDLASKKLALDLEIAKSELRSATKIKEMFGATAKRVKPFADSGAVTQLEFDAIQSEFLSAEATQTTSENSVRQIEFAQSAAKQEIVLLGDRLDDEIGRIRTELEIASAELDEAKIVCKIFENRIEDLISWLHVTGSYTLPIDSRVSFCVLPTKPSH